MREITYAEAISEATCLIMEADSNVVLMGIGMDYSSGVFGTTTDAFSKFGSSRVIDTPAMENALTGIAVGGATVGLKPILVHARNDFLFLALDKLLNVCSKWNYMINGKAGSLPIITRAVIGRGWGQGATHSQSIQSVLAHFPGLRVVMPSTPEDAKGMMIAAWQLGDPIVILEHRSLFSLKGQVAKGVTPTSLNKAKVMREGKDITIIATSICVHESQLVADELDSLGISVEIIDLRSIQPLDKETIRNSIQKTGRALVYDTSWISFGVGAEIGAILLETPNLELKCPLVRIGQLGVPAPTSKPMEDLHYPTLNSVIDTIQKMVRGEYIETRVIPAVTAEFQGPY
jgi:pyruvate dehydrogenase E1 component beta subunit